MYGKRPYIPAADEDHARQVKKMPTAQNGDEDDWDMDETGDIASDDGMEGVDKLPPDHSDTMDHGDTHQTGSIAGKAPLTGTVTSGQSMAAPFTMAVPSRSPGDRNLQTWTADVAEKIRNALEHLPSSQPGAPALNPPFGAAPGATTTAGGSEKAVESVLAALRLERCMDAKWHEAALKRHVGSLLTALKGLIDASSPLSHTPTDGLLHTLAAKLVDLVNVCTPSSVDVKGLVERADKAWQDRVLQQPLSIATPATDGLSWQDAQEHYLQTLEECRRVLNLYDDNFFRPRNVLVQFKTDHLNGLRNRKTSFEKDIEGARSLLQAREAEAKEAANKVVQLDRDVTNQMKDMKHKACTTSPHDIINNKNAEERVIGSTIDFLSTEAGNRVLRERLNLNRTSEDMGQRFLVAKAQLAETEALARLADTVVTLAERWMVTSCDRMDKLAGEAKAICLKRLCDEEFPRVAISLETALRTNRVAQDVAKQSILQHASAHNVFGAGSNQGYADDMKKNLARLEESAKSHFDVHLTGLSSDITRTLFQDSKDQATLQQSLEGHLKRGMLTREHLAAIHASHSATGATPAASATPPTQTSFVPVKTEPGTEGADAKKGCVVC